MHVGRTCRAAGWQPTGPQGLEAALFACWANLKGCRLATYRECMLGELVGLQVGNLRGHRVWRLHYLHVGRTCRAAGWQPTGPQGLEAALFACWANLKGCRLATYRECMLGELVGLQVGNLQGHRVWRLHYLHVGRTCGAVGWQPTGPQGLEAELVVGRTCRAVGWQPTGPQGLEAALFACWANS